MARRARRRRRSITTTRPGGTAAVDPVDCRGSASAACSNRGEGGIVNTQKKGAPPVLTDAEFAAYQANLARVHARLSRHRAQREQHERKRCSMCGAPLVDHKDGAR